MWRIILSAAVLVFAVDSVEAALTIPTVRVGDPGNVGDMRYGPGYGSVDYDYEMGTYEVTAGQYCEFLNAVAATNRFGLYNGNMGAYPHGGTIRIGGPPGNYTYTVTEGREDRTLAAATIPGCQDNPVPH